MTNVSIIIHIEMYRCIELYIFPWMGPGALNAVFS